MTRKEVLNILINLSGSLGPFQKMDCMDDYEKMHTDMYNIMDDDSFEILIDILLNPPEVGRIEPEDFEYELKEAITAIGRRNTQNCLEKVKDLLYVEQVRPVIIDVIGGLDCKEGILLLEPLLELENLTDYELVNLACAFGSIGGLKSFKILKKMKVKYADKSSVVLREIDIGLTTLKY
ncbi:hypothetical protein CLHUN_25970 [Ruminiclostridium hungatei]|uniref:Uncharacterized protein n=1 Tax=Ruminiclostridium hungatei TaxID=48256 RepID=A0A1V4SHV1_RUMHU|nr:hypothetical protein [Ruminiclostridium hungatei]OPX43450.1 hypothetical protein CLHUN_25970 [Ruminiclostridium hungatei]